MKRIKRERELRALWNAKDSHLVKVITGVRRSGKSTLLELFRADLIENEVAEQNIISLNFEDLDNEPLTDYQNLHQYVLDRLQDGKNYVFLDEIQKVDQFEKVVDSLYVRDNIDLYITGSNAYFMSSEFATLLTGRYVEIKVYPFSFAEFASAFPNQSRLDLLFEDYLTYGGFPEVTNLIRAGQTEVVNDYLLGVYNTILNKDIVDRFNITDISALNGITKYLLDNVGNITSPKRISDYLTSNNNKTSYNTVDKYLSALTAGLIFYSVDREDIKGKQILQTLQKYYAVDTGLRRAILTADNDVDMGHLLENVVYFELLRRRYAVTVGKVDGAEVDFVAKNIDSNEKTYFQVAYTAKDSATLERELRPFEKIGDHSLKILLTTDVHETEVNGIKVLNVVNWLLSKESGRFKNE
jgi:predicted AAA+ superfamily ATPase